jgi:hypothetical protein
MPNQARGDVSKRLETRGEVGKDRILSIRSHRSKVASYLAFDVYFAEGCLAKAFKNTGGFSYFHADGLPALVVSLSFENMLCTMGFEKFTASIVVVEAELIREEAKRDIHIAARC